MICIALTVVGCFGTARDFSQAPITAGPAEPAEATTRPGVQADIAEAPVVVLETIREVTAYNVGDPQQTWGDPCIGASGEDLCAALAAGGKRCAANFVPLGTRLQVGLLGVCTVSDRMSRRYRNRVDLAMPLAAKAAALRFGVQKLPVRILADSPRQPAAAAGG